MPALNFYSRLLKKLKPVFITLIMPWFLWGCYSFSQSTLPGHLKSVTIYPVVNQTLDPTLSDKMQSGLQSLFRSNAPNLRQISQGGQCEVKVTLLSYKTQFDVYDKNASVQSYKVEILADVSFKDRIKDKMIYEGKSLRGEGRYFPGRNETEQTGQQRAIEQIQELILSNALSQW